MNSRERVRLSLDHKEPDRVPFDLGGTLVTGIHIQAYRRLRDHLGLPTKDEIPLADVFQQIVLVDEDVRERLKVDVRHVSPGSSAAYELEIKDMGDYTYYYDEWGVGLRMPKRGGFYYDMFDHPLKDATTVEEIESHPWPDPGDPARFEGLREQAGHAAEVEGQAVVLGGFGVGVMERAAWLRGFENFFLDLVANEPLLCRLMDIVLELKMAYWEKALAEVGEYADVVEETEDLGSQTGMLISPDMYRKFAKPRHQELFDFIHAHSDAKVFFHSCGAIRPIIPDLIEVGIDILNPVQVSAVGMDTAELKGEFGQDLTFWGGGVDTQEILNAGTPQKVRDEVKQRIDDLAPGGGFVFATVHNTQPDVPPENFMAMWDTLQECGINWVDRDCSSQ